jgi:hypothetical protein
MAASCVETAMTNIVTEFQAIVKGATYRTSPAQVLRTIRPIDDIAQFPEIGINFGDETIVPIDDAWTVFNSIIDVTVQAAIKFDYDTSDEQLNEYTACENMVYDLKVVLATMMKKYITNSTSAWNVVPKEIVFKRVHGVERIDRDDGDKVVYDTDVVGVSFQIKVRHQDGSWDD